MCVIWICLVSEDSKSWWMTNLRPNCFVLQGGGCVCVRVRERSACSGICKNWISQASLKPAVNECSQVAGWDLLYQTGRHSSSILTLTNIKFKALLLKGMAAPSGLGVLLQDQNPFASLCHDHSHGQTSHATSNDDRIKVGWHFICGETWGEPKALNGALVWEEANGISSLERTPRRHRKL